jgi:glucokinase
VSQPLSGAGLAVGVDVGGTKVAGGVVDPHGAVMALTTAETPGGDPVQGRNVLVDMVRELAASHPVVAVGIGVAGWVDADRGEVGFAPHLPWRDEPLRYRVAAAIDLPVRVENDANAAAWAEFRFGAGRDATDSMLLVALGTGIGAGIVIGGRLVRGAHGIAGEPGHQQAVPDGLPCPCGRRGCWERYASGSALVRLARAGATANPGDASVLLEVAGGPERITGSLVTTAARAGDKVAAGAFHEVARWLGIGLADLVQVLDPQLLVIGGGVAEAGELLLAPARESYLDALGNRSRLPAAPIRLAQLGNLAGVVGAADLARGAR